MAVCDQYAERLEDVREAVFDIEPPISQLRETAQALVDLSEMAKSGERLPNLRLLDILAYEAQAIEQDLRARFKDAHTLVVRPLDQADTDAG